MSYRRASSDEFDGLAAMLFDANADAVRRDLHTHGHPGPESLATDMREYAAKGEFLALVADDGTSAVAAEVSPETRRAWAWGPPSPTRAGTNPSAARLPTPR